MQATIKTYAKVWTPFRACIPCYARNFGVGTGLSSHELLSCSRYLLQNSFRLSLRRRNAAINVPRYLTDSTSSLKNKQNALLEDFSLSEEIAVELYEDAIAEYSDQPETLDGKKKKKDKTSGNFSRKTPKILRYDLGYEQLPAWKEAGVLATIDAYLKSDKIEEALKELNSHRRRGHRFDVQIFNSILHQYAARGDVFGTEMLYNSLELDGIQPTEQTYAALVQVHSVSKSSKEDLERIVDKMNTEGYEPAFIFEDCVLTKRQSEDVLAGLQLAIPGYIPRCRPPRPVVYPAVMSDFHMQDRDSQSSHDFRLPPITAEDMQELVKKQVQCETGGFVNIKSVATVSSHDDNTLRREDSEFSQLTKQWQDALQSTIQKELNEWDATDKKGKDFRDRCAPFCALLGAEELSQIVIGMVIPMVCSQPFGIPSAHVCRQLGAMIHERYGIRHKTDSGFMEKVCDVYNAYAMQVLDPRLNANKRHYELWQECSDASALRCSFRNQVPNWPRSIETVIAGTLIDMLIDVATMSSRKESHAPLHAIKHGYEVFQSKRFGVLSPHHSLSTLYKQHLKLQGDIAMESNRLPMLVPPKPWTSLNQGGYLVRCAPLMRTILDLYKTSELETSLKDGHVVAVLDALNSLGSCAWKINHRVVDLMIDVYNKRTADNCDLIGLEIVPDLVADASDTSPEGKRRLAITSAKWKKLTNEQHSLEMDLLYKLSVANHFRDNVFWLPINLDFRGRVYPIPPHCCHTGGDVARGMLLFARGRTLGEDGLRWLKIHLTNLHGAKKKASLTERAEYADEMMHEIIDSADRPFEGNGWWQTADEPWQTLATCMELTDAVRSGDPASFVSHLPVHQDGSCNGLQHYAALGHDEYGGSQVNLTPSARPADLYSEVAKLVERRRLADAAKGDAIAQKLEGMVHRKVVKQTVMTVVYGVTFVGGRLQIEKQLKDLDFPESDRFKASSYLVKKVFDSISEMFSSAKAIQNWLTNCASQIALAGHCVDWVTPLGLPVVQPYHRLTYEVIRTPLQDVYDQHNFDSSQRPHFRKQKSAFPPNFVHSLDSSHMMLTALYCQRLGINFASVHDSFWTHAADVDAMNKVCREQFVALHEQPILEDLLEHFRKSFSGKPLERPLNKGGRTEVDFSALPKPGSFELDSILKSTYFFS